MKNGIRMKNFKKLLNRFLLLTLSSSMIFGACNPPTESDDKSGNPNIISILKSMPVEEISKEELNGLVFMREEEKLARDVYKVLYAAWNRKIFNNISQSEQRHTDAVKALLTKYDIDDPVINVEIGEFQNSDLLELYNKLIEQGKVTLVEALKVGAVIEEIDIMDLEKRLKQNNNDDIKFVYENLMRGSGNHLRAFVRNLNAQGVEYQPQYLDKTQFDEIISTANERGARRGRRGT